MDAEPMNTPEQEKVFLEPRPITIQSLKPWILRVNHRFSTKVSKGTYVRTLGEDIALKLGTVGHLTGLQRIQSGPSELNSASFRNG